MTYFGIFWKIYVAPDSCKVSLSRLNWFMIYKLGEPFFPIPPRYLLSKKCLGWVGLITWLKIKLYFLISFNKYSTKTIFLPYIPYNWNLNDIFTSYQFSWYLQLMNFMVSEKISGNSIAYFILLGKKADVESCFCESFSFVTIESVSFVIKHFCDKTVTVWYLYPIQMTMINLSLTFVTI